MSNMANDPYSPCACGSGKKFKFCCKEKGTQLSRLSPLGIIKKSREFPVYKCLINEGWQEMGMATIFVIRQLPNLKYSFGTYLVDTFCLGLKNTICNAGVRYDLIENLIGRCDQDLEEINYEDARSIVFGAIKFAEALGFKPQPSSDWSDAQYIIEHDRPFESKFEFGKNGKPVYIQGPDDNPHEIMAKLKNALPKQDLDISLVTRF